MQFRVFMLALGAITIAACASPEARLCQKQAECADTKPADSEVQKCIEDLEELSKTLHETSACSTLAKKWDALVACNASRTCAEAKDSSNEKCKEESSDFFGAIMTAPEACQKAYSDD